MKLFLAAFTWIIIGAILGTGIYLLVPNPPRESSPWLFIIAVIGFIFAVGKIGCKQH